MDSVQYQGLLHLSLGIGSFLTLFLVLRILSEKNKAIEAIIDPTEEWTQKEPLEIVEVIHETHDIKTFRFRRTNGMEFPKYKAGQFLSFQIGENEKLTRSYSISAGSTNKHSLQVSIKKLQNGLGSGWFHEQKPGAKVLAYPPSGHFSDADIPLDTPRIYIAGGIGITPVMSMLLSNLERGQTPSMTLFYGMRTTKDLAFHRLFEYLHERHSSFKYFPILSNPDESWKGETGFVSLKWIVEKGQLPQNAHFFLCGPPIMTDGIIQQLLDSKFDPHQVHTEVFASPISFDPAKIPLREANITFNGHKYHYKSKQTILEFLEVQGEEIPYSCRAGVCGTCKCTVKGKVDFITDAGLSMSEKKQGLFLSCVAFPEQDIEMELAP